MKRINNILSAAGCAALLLAALSCSSDNKAEEFTKKPLAVGQETIEFSQPGDIHTVDITSGNGNYSVAVYPEGASVDATLSGSSITVTARDYGASDIIITDGEGVSAHIQAMVYGKVMLNEYEFTGLINEDRYFKFGVDPEKFRVTFGKPDFSITTDSDIEIIRDGNNVEFIPYEGGNLKIRVTDALGFYADVNLEVEDRFGDFKASTDEVFTFTGMSISTGATRVDDHRIENGEYIFYSEYYNTQGTKQTYIELRFPVAEGLDVGGKDGGKVLYALAGFGGNYIEYTYDVLVKVVKNEGGKIWVVFYRDNLTSTGRLHTDVL
ncbi:MAG: hypothetical protein LUE10_03795 [Alistipes sp.]|nr:hypothetical protein [Alistipes sp.]